MKTNKDETMSEQAAIFADLLEELKEAFYDMPAPESNTLTWSHVSSAEHVNTELKEIIQFLKR